MDLSEVITAQIRGLQAIHAEAHQALRNWGIGSRGTGAPSPHPQPPKTSRDAIRTPEEYGEVEGEDVVVVDQQEVVAEPAEREDYDIRAWEIIDSRIHGPGGLPAYVREAIKVAYVSREIPEDQFHRYAGCTPDAFRERLESALVFVGRFV